MPHELSERTDDVWHRALGNESASGLPGDLAAFAVLQFHGTAMNGGVLNAVETNDEGFVVSAEDGYRWLGLTDISDLVAEVRRAVAEGQTRDLARAEALEVESDDRYLRCVPDDRALEGALRRRVARSPKAFRW